MTSAYSNPSKVNWSTARLMTVTASVDDGVQPAREERELDLVRGRAAGIALSPTHRTSLR